MAISQNTEDTGKAEDQQELSSIACENENGTVTLEDNWVVSYKVKYQLTVSFSNRIPKYLPKVVETYIHIKTCTQIFNTALFIIAVKNWLPPRCPLVGEQINKLCYIHTM